MSKSNMEIFEYHRVFRTEQLSEEEQRKLILMKVNENEKYDYINGKYQVNEKEATNIRNRVAEVISTAEKEEKRRKANKSRSEKMKALWENEEYRKEIIKKIKIGKKMKKLNER